MLRFILTRLSAPAAAALLLAACGGGGGTASVPHATGGSPSSAPTAAPASGSQARLTVKINRAASTRPKKTSAAAARHGAAAKRSPKYVSTASDGLQIAVTAGGTTKTQYVDITQSSAACTNGGGVETCTFAIPWLAASETIAVTEVDEAPTDEGTNGLPAYEGDGFPTNSNILGVGSTQATLTPGTVTNVQLGISAVVGGWYNCWPGIDTASGDTPTSNASFSVESNGNDVGTGVTDRVAVTSGAPAQGFVTPEFADPDGGWYDPDAVALPFVDASGAAAPLTLVSSTSGVTVAPFANPGFANDAGALSLTPSSTTPPGYAQTATIPNDGYEWAECVFIIGINYDGQSTSPSTVTLSNGPIVNGSNVGTSTATGTLYNPASGSFAVGPYNATVTYAIDPISASVSANTASLASGATATVMGSAPGARTAMTLAGGGASESCSGTGAGTVTAGSSANTFSVTPVAQGTCSFQVADGDTGVLSNPVTVTIAGYDTPAGFTASPSSLAFDLVTNAGAQTVSVQDTSTISVPPAIACVANPASSSTVAIVSAYTVQSPTSVTFSVTPGSATGACEVTVSDGAGNKLGVPLTVTENEVGIYAKHRTTK
ncbi:MAG TPA: hypothetical protein VMD91_18590 [Candidatus Sulfotelmatobacter sp.]|nr:hypothetical protein [Candidatus Sulfotelmatobacter sp.]